MKHPVHLMKTYIHTQQRPIYKVDGFYILEEKPTETAPDNKAADVQMMMAFRPVSCTHVSIYIDLKKTTTKELPMTVGP